MAEPAGLQRVGRFVVLEELGRGGMGVVLAAYDPDLDRKVAVKVLHAASGGGAADRSEGRARLLREAQALARLSHPHVITVHDVGTVGEQVFLAMELVRGQTLRQWVQQASGSGAWRSIVAMFRQAGEGLAAAHRAGLVHRDFKPENVIVDAEGRARVLDFGLARADAASPGTASGGASPREAPELGPTERTRPMPGPSDPDAAASDAAASDAANDPSRALTDPYPPPHGPSELHTPLTEVGTVMGTPAYMAPEQFVGRGVDARSDQYAFCVALYEALYDERPFEAATFEELRARVLSGAPPAPSNARDVPAWILRELLRGLRRDPAERHASMDELLEALGREPGRRARRAAAWGMAALAVLGAGWAYQAHLERRLSEAREAADPCADAPERLAGIWDAARRQAIHRAFSDTKLDYAAGTWERVEARLDGYADRWVAAQHAICRATHVDRTQPVALLDVRQACLNSRLSELRAHTTVFARADGHVLEGAIEGIEALRDPDECRTVESMHLELPLPDDDDQAARAVELRQRLDDVEALTGAGHDAETRALAESIATEAEALGYLPLVAEAALALGRAHEHHGHYDEAMVAFDRALWAAEVGRHDAAAVDVWNEWIRTVGYQQHRYELAHAMEPRLDAALQRLGPDVRRRARAHRVLGTLAFAEGDHEAAIGRFEQAIALLEGEPTPDQGQLARAYQNLGTVLYRVDRLDESAEALARSYALTEAIHGPGHPRLSATLQSLGNLALLRGDPVEARRSFEQVIAIVEAVHPPTHPSRADNYLNLGDALAQAGELDGAIEQYERSIEAERLRVRGPPGPPFSSSLALGIALFEAGRPLEARAPLERAFGGAEEPALDPGRLPGARWVLGLILWDADPPERARAVALVTAAHERWLAEGRDALREEAERWLAEHRLPR